MNHMQFEEWLLIGGDPHAGPLLPEQTQALRDHLVVCPACQALAQGWNSAQVALRSAPIAAPVAGFTRRWQARLEVERARLHRRQTLAALGFVAAAAFIVLASLLLLAAPMLGSPSVIFWAWFSRMFSLVSEVSSFGAGALALARSLGGALTLLAWVFLIGLLSELGVLWVVSYRVLTNPRRVTS